MCTTVSVNSDSEVESEEYFTVMLALMVSGTSLSLGNKTSVVTLTDSNGNVLLDPGHPIIHGTMFFFIQLQCSQFQPH